MGFRRGLEAARGSLPTPRKCPSEHEVTCFHNFLLYRVLENERFSKMVGQVAL